MISIEVFHTATACYTDISRQDINARYSIWRSKSTYLLIRGQCVLIANFSQYLLHAIKIFLQADLGIYLRPVVNKANGSIIA